MPGVKAIEGEPMRFLVQSRTRHRIEHLVDLRPYAFNGACGCEHFETRLRSKMEQGALPGDRTRCWHIKRAREYFCDWALPRVERVLREEGAI